MERKERRKGKKEGEKGKGTEWRGEKGQNGKEEESVRV